MSYVSTPLGDRATIVLRCQGVDEEQGCGTLTVLTAMGCSYQDLYPQPKEAAHGPCIECRGSGYLVAYICSTLSGSNRKVVYGTKAG